MKGKMILAANRLPVRFARKDGVLELYPSAGGVATGLGALHRSLKSLWVGWPGMVVTSENDRRAIVKALSRERMRPVILSQVQIAKYYEGFSNRTLWPLFHYFHHSAVFDEELWRAYKNVNQLFCDEVLGAYKPGDTVW
ncbi:MAG: trehalose-6-phosphate synthase, partial [Pseudomonadota bacterium]